MENFDTLETTKIVVTRFQRANNSHQGRLAIGLVLASAFFAFMGVHALQERPFRCFHGHAGVTRTQLSK